MAENRNNNETPAEILNNARQSILNILENEFEDYIDFGDGTFAITHGSTQVMIIVRPFTEDEACVECLSNVVTGAQVNEELLKFLLRSNSEMHFGGFGLLFDDTITYSHSFSASCLEKGELQITVASIAAIADYYDDIIVQSAGGKRAIDLIEELEEK
jgi:hypothetical protein